MTALAALAVSAGCAHTVSGHAQRAGAGTAVEDGDFGYTDDRCGLLVDSSVQAVLRADTVVRPYSGAVCQYVLTRAARPGATPEMLDVIFSWFENGTLKREEELARRRGAQITDTVVERREAFVARRDVTGVACGVTAEAGTGVLSWWVQFRGATAGDPCPEALALLAKTLQAEL